MIHVCISPHGNVVRIDCDEDAVDSIQSRLGGRFLLFYRTVEGVKKYVARVPTDWAIVDERAYSPEGATVFDRHYLAAFGNPPPQKL